MFSCLRVPGRRPKVCSSVGTLGENWGGGGGGGMLFNCCLLLWHFFFI